jgi:hypothetical protein
MAQLSAAEADGTHDVSGGMLVGKPETFYDALQVRCAANGKFEKLDADKQPILVPSFPTEKGCGGNVAVDKLYKLLGLEYLDQRMKYATKNGAKVDPYEPAFPLTDDPFQTQAFLSLSDNGDKTRLWKIHLSTKNCMEKIHFKVAFEDTGKGWKLTSFAPGGGKPATSLYFESIYARDLKVSKEICPALMTAGYVQAVMYNLCDNGGTRADAYAAMWGGDSGFYVWPRMGFNGIASLDASTAAVTWLAKAELTDANDRALTWFKSECKYIGKACTATFPMHRLFNPDSTAFKNYKAAHTAAKYAWRDREGAKIGLDVWFKVQPNVKPNTKPLADKFKLPEEFSDVKDVKAIQSETYVSTCAKPDPDSEAGVAWKLLQMAKDDSDSSLAKLVQLVAQ